MPPKKSYSMMHVLMMYTFVKRTEMMPRLPEIIRKIVKTTGVLRPW